MIKKIKHIILNQDFLSLLGNLVYAALGFVSFLILTRSFPKDVFGEWVLFITAANFIEMFRFGITRTAIVRFLSGANESEKEKLIGANWLIGIVITVFLVIVIFVVNLFFSGNIKSSGFGLFFLWYPLIQCDIFIQLQISLYRNLPFDTTAN